MAAAIPAVLNRFAELWAVDFEFIARPGERPDPVCCVAHELRSGRDLRLWDSELRLYGGLPLREGALFIAYYAPAELGCYRALGWSMPVNVLDLFAEFRNFTNGREGQLGVRGASLLSALGFFGLSHLDPQVKDAMRDRVLAGRPYSAADRAGILDYCAADTAALGELLLALAERLQSRPHWLEHALLRGRYMRAVAEMEHNGVPMDAALLGRLSRSWEPIKSALIDSIRQEFDVFDGTTLKADRFEAWLEQRGIPWPRTETGRLSTSEETFRQMGKSYPAIEPIREVRDRLGKLRLTDIAVGADCRNRCMLSPFRARSGRNAPSASKFIFAPSVWLRSLIRPERGRALAYLDFAGQEIAIAAVLSGDGAMLAAYESGDPYLDFAIRAGLAPRDATRATHKAVRERCKALVLGVLYGMGEDTLAGNLNVQVCEARSLLRHHQRTYRRFWEWSQAVKDTAMLMGYLDTIYGWRLHVTGETRPTSLMNHPMQSNGAEMLRLACSFMTEAGIGVCAPVHDAVLIEAPAEQIDHAVADASAQMVRASRIVLGGVECRVEAAVTRWPARYQDPRGIVMWDRVTALLEEIEGRAETMEQDLRIVAV